MNHVVIDSVRDKDGEILGQHHIVGGLGRLPDGSTLIPGEPRQAWLSQYQVLGTKPWQQRQKAAIAMWVLADEGGILPSGAARDKLTRPSVIRIEASVR